MTKNGVLWLVVSHIIAAGVPMLWLDWHHRTHALQAATPVASASASAAPGIPEEVSRWVVCIPFESEDYPKFNNAELQLQALERFVREDPLNRNAPLAQHEIARFHEAKALLSDAGSQQAKLHLSFFLQALVGLGDYIGNTPWVEKNKHDVEAMKKAEALVRGNCIRL